MLTVLSAASILATRDWLFEPKRAATSVWVKPIASRRRRRPAANASFVSMKRRSSADNSKNVSVSPTIQPARSTSLALVASHRGPSSQRSRPGTFAVDVETQR